MEKLEQIEGKDWAEKIVTLLTQHILTQLRECDERMLKYAAKYGMDFEQFEAAWKNGVIANKHSHEVERDLMEWEGLLLERKRWFSMLRALKP